MLVEHYCKKCGKEFYPTPEHVYKDHTGMYCCWTCFDYHRKNDKRRRKRIDMLDRDGNVIDTFPSANYAARILTYSDPLRIQKACRTGMPYHGYHWRYANDNKKKGEK